MIRRLVISSILFLSLAGGVQAQQMWMYNAHQFNIFDVNHAFAGQYDDASFALRYRNQWLNIKGAPRTAMLSMHAPLGESIGGGMQVRQESIGLHNWTFIKLVIAYHVEINKSRLAFALVPGFAGAKFDSGGAYTVTAEQTNFAPQGSWALNADFSVLYWSERILAGIQVSNLNTPDLSYISVAGVLSRHVDAFVAYTYPIDRHAIKPVLSTRFIPGGKLSFDASAQFFWREQIWVGAGWRSGNSIFGLMELELGKGLRAGYTFDFFSDQRLPSSRGSHEIFLAINFALSKSSTQSIRYFK